MNEPNIRRMSERKAASVEEDKRKERPVTVANRDALTSTARKVVRD